MHGQNARPNINESKYKYYLYKGITASRTAF
jgi:hypothetical protein